MHATQTSYSLLLFVLFAFAVVGTVMLPRGTDVIEFCAFSCFIRQLARLIPLIGLEGLYGHKEEKSGADGDAFRLQLGVLYSIFD